MEAAKDGEGNPTEDLMEPFKPAQHQQGIQSLIANKRSVPLATIISGHAE